MEALEHKLMHLNERVRREEKMWEALLKLQRVYEIFFNTKSEEAKEVEKMVSPKGFLNVGGNTKRETSRINEH